MKNLFALFLLSISFSISFAQNSKPQNPSSVRSKSNADAKKEDRPIRPVEIQNLVTDAYYTQPEFAADALMRLAKSKKVADKLWKKELIEAAFRFAAEAQHSARRKSAVLGSYSVDTDAGYLSYAFGQNLDRLSLQSRAVKMMLELDKQRARELFGEMSEKLKFAPLSCDDALVYDVSEFYDTLRLIAEKTFTPSHIENGERMLFVLPYIEAISSHTQIVPALKIIVALKPTVQESLILVAAFSQALKNIKADDRSFSFELVRGAMLREVFQLTQTLGQQEIPSQSLLQTYRAYVQKNLSEKRCADSAINEERNLSAVLRDANSFFFKNASLTADDVKSDGILGRAKIYEYWQSSRAKRLQTLIKELRFGVKTALSSANEDNEDKPLTAEEKQTSAWREQLNYFLIELNAWSEEDERSEIDYFHQKQVLYLALAEIVPDSATRNLIVQSWTASLSDESIEKRHRIEWHLYANYLVKFADKSMAEERAKLFEAITGSKNSSLAFYAKIAQQKI